MLKRVPYLPFTTFDLFLDDLRVRGLPGRIDRSLLAGKSGPMQSQILSALRYLGLTSATGDPTQYLMRLLQTEGQEREQVWETILRNSYSGLFQLDLERATTEEFLDELLKEGMSSQDTIRKALNFFSLAARAAGIRISPHIKPYAGRRQSAQRDPVSRRDRFKVVSLPLPRRSTPKSIESKTGDALLNKFPEFNPSWPEKERNNWLDGFRQLLTILRDAEKSDADQSSERTAS